jgi:hypothetical protein
LKLAPKSLKVEAGITIEITLKQLPGVNVIKKFPLSLMLRPTKLEGLSLETLSSQVLALEGKARANPIGAPFRCFLLG